MYGYKSRRPGRWIAICLAPGLCAGFLTLTAAAQEPPRWTLAEALETAFRQSPELRARQVALQEAASGLLTAETYPHNPELELEVAQRRGPAGSTTDRGLRLTQELEVAGQRRRRVAAAGGELAAAELTLRREGRRLAFRVEQAFVEALRERELLRVAETDAALAREMLAFSMRRLERGVTTQIEVNLARASAGRAERGVQQARAAYASARGRLAEVVGLGPAAQPEPRGELAVAEVEPPPLEDLVHRARRNRSDLAAARLRRQAAAAAVRLAVAEGRPNLQVGAFLQQEEGTDDILGATVGLSFPLFDRNQGRIAESRALREGLRYEHEALGLAIEGEVVAAFNELKAARASAEFLREQVLGTLEDNVELLQRSFSAGRIGATEVVTLRREFVASRREYVEVQADAQLARLRLDLATGDLPAGEPTSGKELP